MTDSFLLLETGDYLLLETGDKIILEEGVAPVTGVQTMGAHSRASFYTKQDKIKDEITTRIILLAKVRRRETIPLSGKILRKTARKVEAKILRQTRIPISSRIMRETRFAVSSKISHTAKILMESVSLADAKARKKLKEFWDMYRDI